MLQVHRDVMGKSRVTHSEPALDLHRLEVSHQIIGAGGNRAIAGREEADLPPPLTITQSVQRFRERLHICHQEFWRVKRREVSSGLKIRPVRDGVEFLTITTNGGIVLE